jgi:hypothetical protein
VPENNIGCEPLPPDFTARVTRMLATLASLLNNVRVTQDGTFVAECPSDPSHDTGVWISGGKLTFQCPDCCVSAERYAAFGASLKALFGENSIVAAESDEAVAVSDWTPQPVTSPLLATRRMSNGALRHLVRPGREAEVTCR